MLMFIIIIMLTIFLGTMINLNLGFLEYKVEKHFLETQILTL